MKNKPFLKLLVISVAILAGCQKVTPRDQLSGRQIVGVDTATTSAAMNSEETTSTSSLGIKTPSRVQNGEAQTSTATEAIMEPYDVKTFDLRPEFGSQAPFGVWDELHEESCEEASMIIVDSYVMNKPLNAHVMEQGIIDLTNWEKLNGYLPDLTAAETRQILIDYFKIKAELIENPSVEVLKKTLKSGKLIIVPAAGRLLNNPYFQTPGPIYHMLVIRGYDETKKEFITNDPGTKHGEGFRYKYDVLLNALHDWNHELALHEMSKADMLRGAKVVVVVN